jgi:ABC-type oligopeptide transport system substrate-binding subunit
VILGHEVDRGNGHVREGRVASVKLLALIAGLSLVAVTCSGDDDDGAGAGDERGASGSQPAEPAVEGAQGGEIVDLSAFAGDPPEHIDPRLNTSVAGWQVGGSLYDGLTDIDYSDPENPEVRGVVAESWGPKDDATEWTFRIRDELFFSDGTPVLPSSFVRGWETATDPDFAGDYAYLYTFIKGGAEKLIGEADTISGVEADDRAMTLTVTLSAPLSTFPSLVGFAAFMPMPKAIEELDDQADWENQVMVGNGPFVLEGPRTDREIVLVPNDRWDGTKYDEEWGLPEQPFLDRITFRASGGLDVAYTAFEAGEADITSFLAGRYQEAQDNYATSIDTPAQGAYYFWFNDRDERVGGQENRLLRQAISQAIDRQTINAAVYEGSRVAATGITPPAILGAAEGLCEYCSYDPEAAEADYQEWLDAGNELAEPLPIQFDTGAGHENVVAIIVENLNEIGIPAEAQGIDSETYFDQRTEGACVICRANWIADYPTYDHFMYDLFHTESLDGNNYGYSNPEFDELIDEAKATTDEAERAELFRAAEQILLNEDVGVIPINWYRGTLVYDGDRIAHINERPDLHVEWETVSLQEGAA